MAPTVESVEINRTPEDVFAYLDDLVFADVVRTSGGASSVNSPTRAVPVKYGFINRGRTPAFLTECCQRLVESMDPINPDEEKLEGRMSLRGQDVGTNTPFMLDIDFEADRIDLNSLFLIGYVRYRDIFRKRHITGFCAKYSPIDNRFRLIGGGSYNYTRNEQDAEP